MTGQRFLPGPRISRSPVFAKTLCVLGLTFNTKPGSLHVGLGSHILLAQILRVKDESRTSGLLRSLLNYCLTHVHGLYSQQCIGNLQSMLGIFKAPKGHFSPQFFLLNWFFFLIFLNCYLPPHTASSPREPLSLLIHQTVSFFLPVRGSLLLVFSCVFV